MISPTGVEMQNQSLASVRLLIVEDQLIVAQDLRAQLEEFGYTVVGTAASAHEALRKAREQAPTLVLMDIRLRGRTDGIAVASTLRSQYDLPVVFLTANTDPITLERALESEPVGYLAKPYTRGTLQATLALALRRHESVLHERQAEAQRARLVQQNAELAALARRLHAESTLDALTGLYNRRYLDAALQRELRRAQRERRSVGIILLDLDRFKRLNDSFGHVAADAALQAIAELLRSRLRAYDAACRYGGEEIVIVLPGSRTAEAAALAEQLRTAIEQLVVEHRGVRLSQVTASFGVSSYPEDALDPNLLLEAADAALYLAKAAGRNRVSVAPRASAS
jgi:diguanylate cyclase (GGDEF)-like protein